MRELRGNLAIAGILLGLFCAAAPAGEPLDTATVDVLLTILPYAQITLTADTVQVTLPEGAATAICDPVAVGGTVICNCAVSRFGNVTPPVGKP